MSRVMKTIYNDFPTFHNELTKVLREYAGNCIILKKELNESDHTANVVIRDSIRDEYNTHTYETKITFRVLKSGKGFAKRPIKDETLSIRTRPNLIRK